MGFQTGQLVATRTIFNRAEEDIAFLKFVWSSYERFLHRDWGELDEADKKLNDSALKNGDDRILASYEYGNEKIYIQTDYGQACTTIMFAYEY